MAVAYVNIIIPAAVFGALVNAHTSTFLPQSWHILGQSNYAQNTETQRVRNGGGSGIRTAKNHHLQYSSAYLPILFILLMSQLVHIYFTINEYG